MEGLGHRGRIWPGPRPQLPPATGMITRYSPASGRTSPGRRVEAGGPRRHVLRLAARSRSPGETRTRPSVARARMNGYHIEGLAHQRATSPTAEPTHPEPAAGRCPLTHRRALDNGVAARPPGRRLALMALAADDRLPQPAEPDPRVAQAMAASSAPRASEDCTPTRCAAGRRSSTSACGRSGSAPLGDPGHWSSHAVVTRAPSSYPPAPGATSTARRTCSGSTTSTASSGWPSAGTLRIFELFSPREWELPRRPHAGAPRAGARERAPLPDAGAASCDRAGAEGRPRLPGPDLVEHRVHDRSRASSPPPATGSWTRCWLGPGRPSKPTRCWSGSKTDPACGGPAQRRLVMKHPPPPPMPPPIRPPLPTGVIGCPGVTTGGVPTRDARPSLSQ